MPKLETVCKAHDSGKVIHLNGNEEQEQSKPAWERTVDEGQGPGLLASLGLAAVFLLLVFGPGAKVQ